MRLPIIQDPFSLPPAPATDGRLDCVLIGHNDALFDGVASRVRPTREVSASYADLKLNSVLHQGRRVNYIELLNHALAAARGSDPRLHVMDQASLAVCLLTSFLRKRGLTTEYINRFNAQRGHLRELLKQRPRAVAITTTFYTEDQPIIDVVRFVREHAPEAQVIVGGPRVFNICSNFDPETQDYLFEGIGADIYVFDSQGEATLAALVQALRHESPSYLQRVPNLVYTRDGRTFQRTARKAEDNDLDADGVDWSLLEPAFLKPSVVMRTARSCPFACSFCNFPSRAGEHVVNDVEVIVSQLRYLRSVGVENVSFVDDTLNVPLPRFKKMLRRMIEEDLGLRWTSFFRCSNADDETFDLMQRSGCVGVFLGIESGDQELLSRMEKSARVERYHYGIRSLEDRGIFTYASFIVGFPGETERSVANTIAFIEKAAPTFYYPQVYYHDPGSPIFLQSAEYAIQGEGHRWSHATMDWRGAVTSVHQMYRSVSRSTLLPSWDMSSWGAFYLVTHGFSLSQIRSFAAAARRMVLEGFEERESPEGFAELVALFRS